MGFSILISLILAISSGAFAGTKDKKAVDELFAGPVLQLRVEIPQEGMAVLRGYRPVWGQERPERIDVHARVREGDQVYEDVAVSFQRGFSYLNGGAHTA